MQMSFLNVLYRLIVLAVVLALAATLWMLIARMPKDGARTPAPAADSELSEIASEIRPTIAAIERVRQEIGSYPAKAAELAARLPTGVLVDATNAGDEDALSIDIDHGVVWVYARDDDGQGYDLTRHLTDGGSLVATSDHGHIVWSHAAGGDDDASPVTLAAPN